VVGESQIRRRRESLVLYKSFNTLWVWGGDLPFSMVAAHKMSFIKTIESHKTVFQSLKPELEGTYTCKAANKLGQIETAYQVHSDVIMTSVFKREKCSIEKCIKHIMKEITAEEKKRICRHKTLGHKSAES
jgi:hypothetical protein